VISGDTWAELTGRIDARLATLAGPVNGARLSEDFAGNLARTVHRYGELARAGVDAVTAGASSRSRRSSRVTVGPAAGHRR
jgi:hypothetical protein